MVRIDGVVRRSQDCIIEVATQADSGTSGNLHLVLVLSETSQRVTDERGH